MKVVQVCGFEALPADLAILLAADAARERWGEELVSVDLDAAVASPPGMPRLSDSISGGTLQSMLEVARAENAGAAADPAALIDDADAAAAVRRVSPIVLAPRRGRDEDVIAPMMPGAVHQPRRHPPHSGARRRTRRPARRRVPLSRGDRARRRPRDAAAALGRGGGDDGDAGGAARAHTREPRRSGAGSWARSRTSLRPPASARRRTGSRAGRWRMAVDARTSSGNEIRASVARRGPPRLSRHREDARRGRHPAGRGRRDAARAPAASRPRSRSGAPARRASPGRACASRWTSSAPATAPHAVRSASAFRLSSWRRAITRSPAGSSSAHRQPADAHALGGRAASRASASAGRELLDGIGDGHSSEHGPGGEQRDRAPGLEVDEPEDLHHPLSDLETLEPLGQPLRAAPAAVVEEVVAVGSSAQLAQPAEYDCAVGVHVDRAEERLVALVGEPVAGQSATALLRRRTPLVDHARPAHRAAVRVGRSSARVARSSAAESRTPRRPRPRAPGSALLAPRCARRSRFSAVQMEPPLAAAERIAPLAASMAEQIERERQAARRARARAPGRRPARALPAARAGRPRGGPGGDGRPRSSGSRAATARPRGAR